MEIKVFYVDCPYHITRKVDNNMTLDEGKIVDEDSLKNFVDTFICGATKFETIINLHIHKK